MTMVTSKHTKLKSKSTQGNQSETVENSGNVKAKVSGNLTTVWPMLSTAVAFLAICIGYCYYYYYLDINLIDRTQLSTNNIVLASAKQPLAEWVQHQLQCSSSYKAELTSIRPDCQPSRCGRFVHDGIASKSDADALLALAKRGFSFGGGSGGATILDLHSGALSMGDKFVNVYQLAGRQGGRGFAPTESERRLYASVVNRIRLAVAAAFNVSNADSLRLTKPTFFSRLTSAKARTKHDEYWHSHVDKDTYGSFHYTSLLYLADYGTNFTGGRFLFIDESNAIPDKDKSGSASSAQRRVTFVEPRLGRVSAFTSGSENTHRVEQVTSGERFALTIAFTCDPSAAIDPNRMGGG